MLTRRRLVLINTWVDEVEKYAPFHHLRHFPQLIIYRHLDGTLKKLRYHGLRRKGWASEFEKVDIVVTTYHTLVADYKDKSSPLHKLEWFRIVLDEGPLNYSFKSKYC
jgi:SNF2 family DNA or RNA helicase